MFNSNKKEEVNTTPRKNNTKIIFNNTKEIKESLQNIKQRTQKLFTKFSENLKKN
jgi:hypothetical protein